MFKYIVESFSTSEDRNELLRVFKILDKDNDGKLSAEELLNGNIKYLKFL